MDVELGGKHRAVGITREAIEDYLGLSPDAAAEMTEVSEQRLSENTCPRSLLFDGSLMQSDMMRR